MANPAVTLLEPLCFPSPTHVTQGWFGAVISVQPALLLWNQAACPPHVCQPLTGKLSKIGSVANVPDPLLRARAGRPMRKQVTVPGGDTVWPAHA